MIQIDNILDNLVPLFIGAWVFWVTRTITRLSKDVDAAHMKLRIKGDKKQ